MGLALTSHAIRRYQERVKPALELAACEEEIHRLATTAHITNDRPFPIPDDVDGDTLLTEPGGYMELAPQIWGILARNGKRWVMVTVHCHLAVSDKRRERRRTARTNSRRYEQRRRRKYVYSQGKRRTRLEPWQ